MKSVLFLLVLYFTFDNVHSFSPEYFNELAIKEEKEGPDIIPYLKIKEGDFIADLGAGGGHFSVKFSKEVGQKGKIFAIDIDQESIIFIKKYANQNKKSNIIAILASPDDSKLPSDSLDLIFIRNTYHHLQNRITYFRKLSKKLKKNGRIVIIDYLPEKTYFPGHSSKISTIMNEMKKANFKLKNKLEILPRQSFLIFIKNIK